jgi:hypothetical protein
MEEVLESQESEDKAREVYPSVKEVKTFWDTVIEAKRVLGEARDRGHASEEGEFSEEVRALENWIELRSWDVPRLRERLEILKAQLGIGEIIGYDWYWVEGGGNSANKLVARIRHSYHDMYAPLDHRNMFHICSTTSSSTRSRKIMMYAIETLALPSIDRKLFTQPSMRRLLDRSRIDPLSQVERRVVTDRRAADECIGCGVTKRGGLNQFPQRVTSRHLVPMQFRSRTFTCIGIWSVGKMESSTVKPLRIPSKCGGICFW